MTKVRDKTFQHWCIVEMLGHNVTAGFVTEQTVAGAGFIRIDVPETTSQPAFSKFVGPSSIYSITPTTEEIARFRAESLRVKPINEWDLPESYREALAAGRKLLLACNDNPEHIQSDDLEDEDGNC